jgi:hypothetical protein
MPLTALETFKNLKSPKAERLSANCLCPVDGTVVEGERCVGPAWVEKIARTLTYGEGGGPPRGYPRLAHWARFGTVGGGDGGHSLLAG